MKEQAQNQLARLNQIFMFSSVVFLSFYYSGYIQIVQK